MKRSHGKSMFFLILMSTALLVGIAVAGEPATGSVYQVRDRWAQINYQLPKPQRKRRSKNCCTSPRRSARPLRAMPRR